MSSRRLAHQPNLRPRPGRTHQGVRIEEVSSETDGFASAQSADDADVTAAAAAAAAAADDLIGTVATADPAAAASVPDTVEGRLALIPQASSIVENWAAAPDDPTIHARAAESFSRDAVIVTAAVVSFFNTLAAGGSTADRAGLLYGEFFATLLRSLERVDQRLQDAADGISRVIRMLAVHVRAAIVATRAHADDRARHWAAECYAQCTREFGQRMETLAHVVAGQHADIQSALEQTHALTIAQRADLLERIASLHHQTGAGFEHSAGELSTAVSGLRSDIDAGLTATQTSFSTQLESLATTHQQALGELASHWEGRAVDFVNRQVSESASGLTLTLHNGLRDLSNEIYEHVRALSSDVDTRISSSVVAMADSLRTQLVAELNTRDAAQRAETEARIAISEQRAGSVARTAVADAQRETFSAVTEVSRASAANAEQVALAHQRGHAAHAATIAELSRKVEALHHRLQDVPDTTVDVAALRGSVSAVTQQLAGLQRSVTSDTTRNNLAELGSKVDAMTAGYEARIGAYESRIATLEKSLIAEREAARAGLAAAERNEAKLGKQATELNKQTAANAQLRQQLDDLVTVQRNTAAAVRELEARLAARPDASAASPPPPQASPRPIARSTAAAAGEPQQGDTPRAEDEAPAPKTKSRQPKSSRPARVSSDSEESSEAPSPKAKRRPKGSRAARVSPDSDDSDGSEAPAPKAKGRRPKSSRPARVPSDPDDSDDAVSTDDSDFDTHSSFSGSTGVTTSSRYRSRRSRVALVALVSISRTTVNPLVLAEMLITASPKLPLHVVARSAKIRDLRELFSIYLAETADVARYPTCTGFKDYEVKSHVKSKFKREAVKYLDGFCNALKEVWQRGSPPDQLTYQIKVSPLIFAFRATFTHYVEGRVPFEALDAISLQIQNRLISHGDTDLGYVHPQNAYPRLVEVAAKDVSNKMFLRDESATALKTKKKNADKADKAPKRAPASAAADEATTAPKPAPKPKRGKKNTSPQHAQASGGEQESS